MVNPLIEQLVLKYPFNLLRLDFVISLFTECEFPKVKIDTKSNTIIFDDPSELMYHIQLDREYYIGKLVTDQSNKKLYYISNKDSDNIYVELLDKITNFNFPLIESHKEKITISKNHLNIVKSNNITTTYGRLILNVFLIEHPFYIYYQDNKDMYLISYHNEQPFDIDKLFDEYKLLLLKKQIHAPVVHKMFTNVDYLQSYAPVFVPSVSEKMITVDPKIKKKKEELIKKYKDKLNDPEVMVKIEDELIKLDKEYLKGDESEVLFSKKTFNIHRKLMFIGFGALPTFGDDIPGYNMVLSDLDEGMKKEDCPMIFNEARRGFYSRGVGTAKGGQITKDIFRLLQDTEITTEDCKTKRYLKFNITKDNYKDVLNRYIIDKNKTILLTVDNIKDYIGKEVKLRSPMMCEAKDGYCYKCCDYIWELKRMQPVNIIPISISSAIMNSAMKSMHGTKVENIYLEDLDQFVY